MVAHNDQIIVKQLEDQIKNLQNEVQVQPEQELNQTVSNNNLENSDSTINVVNKDFFNNNIQNVDTNFNELNSNKTDNLQKNVFENNDIVQNTKSNLNNTNQIIQNEINKLQEKREQLLNRLYLTEAQNKNIFDTKNISNNSNTESKVLVDNFTPNFAFVSEEQQQAIDRSVEAESTFGNEPKMVSDNFGNPAVISEDQVNLETAIEQHGGIDNALQDSANQQEFLNNESLQPNTSVEENNTFNNESKSSTKEGDTTFKEENTFENIDNSFDNMKQDNNTDIIKNTGKTVAAIEGLSKQFNNLANAITKGFNSVNGKIQDMGKQSQNNVTNNYGGESGGSSPQTATKSKNNLSPEIRGDIPLKQHFPSNFDLNNLQSFHNSATRLFPAINQSIIYQ